MRRAGGCCSGPLQHLVILYQSFVAGKHASCCPVATAASLLYGMYLCWSASRCCLPCAHLGTCFLQRRTLISRSVPYYDFIPSFDEVVGLEAGDGITSLTHCTEGHMIAHTIARPMIPIPRNPIFVCPGSAAARDAVQIACRGLFGMYC
jgi:hypothetical protein